MVYHLTGCQVLLGLSTSCWASSNRIIPRRRTREPISSSKDTLWTVSDHWSGPLHVIRREWGIGTGSRGRNTGKEFLEPLKFI